MLCVMAAEEPRALATPGVAPGRCCASVHAAQARRHAAALGPVRRTPLGWWHAG